MNEAIYTDHKLYQKIMICSNSLWLDITSDILSKLDVTGSIKNNQIKQNPKCRKN